MTRPRFTLAALADLDSVFGYIAQDNPAAATRTLRSIRAAAEHLALFPNIGRPGRIHGMREYPVAGLPYIIAYHVGDEQVTVVAVLHGARDFGRTMRTRGEDTSEP